MKKQAFGISIVSVVIIGIGSLLSSCDFRMSVKDRTGETQEYTAESAAAENTLPLEVVKYQQLDINQIGKVLYDMSEEQVENYLRNQGKDPYFYLGVSTNGEGFYSINSEFIVFGEAVPYFGELQEAAFVCAVSALKSSYSIHLQQSPVKPFQV